MVEQTTTKEGTARLGDLRISPRKVRLVTDAINHRPVQAAEWQLSFMSKKAARPVLKLIRSAVANAQNNFQLDPKNLYIKSITVNQGYMLKRFKPRAQGRAHPIRRRTSIVDVTLISKQSKSFAKRARKAAGKREKEA